MLYELVNPSDPYTLECDDLEVAAIVSCLLGEGKTPLRDVEKDELAVPFFLFGGHDEWFRDRFGRDFSATLTLVAETKRDQLVKAFESLVIGSVSDRAIYRSAMDNIPDEERRKAFARDWADKKRSSITDYGRSAVAYAKHFRKPPARQQQGG